MHFRIFQNFKFNSLSLYQSNKILNYGLYNNSHQSNLVILVNHITKIIVVVENVTKKKNTFRQFVHFYQLLINIHILHDVKNILTDII